MRLRGGGIRGNGCEQRRRSHYDQLLYADDATCSCPVITGQDAVLGVVHGCARVKPDAARLRAARG